MSGNIVGNRYELLEKIGSGGMAIVYKARCRLLNRFVAIKILRPEFNNDAEFLKRFETEAQAAASLSHPNIVSVYDVGVQDDMRYIVMEYVQGITLKEYLVNNGPLPIEKIVDFSLQIASALEHAHVKKIIHHDIKPHNIIITLDGHLKVTDFGLARAVSTSTTVAGVGAVGSVHYASPEQARGGFTDEKSDIYSLGVTMYEMTTGRVPFDGETPVSVAMKHLQKEPTPPSAIAPDVPVALEEIILKCMVKDVAGRFKSATEIISALRAVFDGAAVVVKKNVDDDDNSSTRRLPSMEEIEEEKKRAERARKTEINREPEIKKSETVKAKKEVSDEEYKRKKKKEDSVAIVAAIATTLVIVGVLVVIMINLLSSGGDNSGIRVPSFTNMTYEEAEELAKEYSLGIEIANYEYNDTVEVDKIISQDPEEGNSVSENTQIKVIISRGEEHTVLQDYKNSKADDVKADLRDKGIKFEEEEIFSDDVTEGRVVKTEPKASSKISEDTVVTIYISKGPEKEETVVPNLIEETVENAKTLLYNRGLEVGEISYIDSSKPKDMVIQQSPVSGSSVEDGSKVNLVLSRGKEQEQQPEETQEPVESSEPENGEDTGQSPQPAE